MGVTLESWKGNNLYPLHQIELGLIPHHTSLLALKERSSYLQPPERLEFAAFPGRARTTSSGQEKSPYKSCHHPAPPTIQVAPFRAGAGAAQQLEGADVRVWCPCLKSGDQGGAAAGEEQEYWNCTNRASFKHRARKHCALLITFFSLNVVTFAGRLIYSSMEIFKNLIKLFL